LITKELKAKAIAQLKHLVPIEDIAEQLELPVNLIREWKDSLSTQDLTKIESVLQVVGDINNGELLDMQITIEQIDEVMKQAALDLSGLIVSAANYNDPQQALAVDVCSNALTKLYKTFVEPYKAISRSISTTRPLYEQLTD
jgi:hypothetical protein